MQNYGVSFDQRQPGHMIAHAENKMGTFTSNGSVIVSDIDEPFMITTNKSVFAVGEAATIECGAIIYNYSSKLEWTFNGKNVEQIPGIIVENYTTKYSHRKALKWQYINKHFRGLYLCDSFERASGKFVKNLRIYVSVNDPEAPKIRTNFNQTSYEKSEGDFFKVQCKARGLPEPTLIWYKNDKVFNPTKKGNDTRKDDIVISDDNFTITFNYLRKEYSGKYRCRAENEISKRIFVDEKEFELTVEGNCILGELCITF